MPSEEKESPEKEVLQEKEPSEKNRTSQSLVKENLKNVEKDVMKFFEENNCSVCLSN